MRVLERLARETGREYALRVLKENIVGLDLLPVLCSVRMRLPPV